MILIIIFILIIYVVFYLNFEKSRGLLWTSPFSMMVIGNIPVLLIYGLFANYFYYHALRFETVLCLLFGLFVFSIPGLPYLTKKNRFRSCNCSMKPMKSGIATKLSLIISFIMLLSVRAIGVDNMGEEDAASLYAANGIRGHMLVMQIFLMAHMLIHKSKHNCVRLIAVALAGVSIFFYQVKIWMFTPFIIALMVKVGLYNYKLSLIKVTVASSLIFVLFALSYMPSFGYDLSEETQIFLFNHFTKYLFAGIGGLNEAIILNLPIGQNPLSGLPPFVSMFISNHFRVNDAYNYLVINDLNGEYTNVFTLYGQQYLFTGIILSSLYMITLSFISYLLFFLYKKTNNYWFKLCYYYWSLGLVMSFFANYYTLLNIWELTFYSFICGYFTTHKILWNGRPAIYLK